MARILVIDDDPGIRRIVRRVLEGAGHSVAVCENGRAALAEIEREAPEILITDIFMPEMEGLETIRRVRAAHPGVPIIAISGVGFEGKDYLPVAERFGAVATLQKPFRPAELMQLVVKLLG